MFYSNSLQNIFKYADSGFQSTKFVAIKYLRMQSLCTAIILGWRDIL